MVDRVRRSAPRCAVAAPVWHELRSGVARLPSGKRRTALAAFLDDVVARFPILPYDEAAAAWHALERARLERAGKAPSFVDGQIAAIAAVNDLTVVSLDRRGFRGFRGLRVEDWSAAR